LSDEWWDIEIHNDPPNLRSLEVEKRNFVWDIIKAQPNPANSTVWITYRDEPGAGKIEIDIWDPLGRIILKSDVTSNKGIFEWSSSNVAEGIYLVRLSFDGKIIDTEKITIQH